MVKLRKFAYLGKNEFAELHKKQKENLFGEAVNLLNFIKEYIQFLLKNNITFTENEFIC